MRKRAALLLIAVLAASSLIAVNLALASIPKPSVPEFTVKLVAHPYDVPPKTTTTMDPYTGKETVTTQPGYHVENKSIEITIKNQPYVFPPNSTGYSFRYNVRVKGHFGKDWSLLDSHSYISTPSSPEYTVFSYSLSKFHSDPTGAQVDFQVEAIVGHEYYYSPFPDHPLAIASAFAVDEASGWSNIQTLIFYSNGTVTGPYTTPFENDPQPDPNTSPSQNPITSTPDQIPTPSEEPPQTRQFEAILDAVIVVAAISVGLGLLIYLAKRK